MRRTFIIVSILFVTGISFSMKEVSGSFDLVSPVYAAASDSSTRLFLRVDGVAGDVIDDAHKGELSPESFAISITRALGATRPVLGELRATLPVSTASPKLLVYAASGGRIPKAVLTIRSGSQDIGRWILTDVALTSYQTVGNTHGDDVSEQITLSYAKIEFEYSSTLRGEKTRGGWDQRANKAIQ